MKYRYVLLLTIVLAFGACRHYDSEYAKRHQDTDAKELMQGIWIDDEEGAPVLMAHGDSVFFPDTTSLPVAFWIYQDSLYLQGGTTDRYLITKQSEHVLRFINQSGEEVKIVKAEGQQLRPLFMQERPYALNIFRTLVTDTVGMYNIGRIYNCHISVEPTHTRVMVSTFKEAGIRVDNMYLDNEAQVNIRLNKQPFYEHRFVKQDFAAFVPKDFIQKAILSRMQYDRVDSAAIYLDAVIGVPDATSAFVIEVKVGKNGKVTKKLK